jgi:transaldolase / glucose-6-phosphate isomerase
VAGTLAEWAAGDKLARLWRGDATLWTGRDEDRWVGWLRLVEQQRARREEFGRVAEDARLAGFGHAVVLGMGGSSLAPDVFARTFGRVPGHPVLRVLDSTVPAAIRSLEAEIDLRRTIFLAASKSGTTVEPNALLDHFLERTRSLLGGQAPTRFVAITDPGTELERRAQREGFRRVFHGVPSVGGRYSALSHFGMVPAAAMGVPVPRLLDRAQLMADACADDRSGSANPGLELGVVLGAAARDGVDKLTLVASPAIAAIADWIEQLVAESLGKRGRGIVPVVGEPVPSPRAIGSDRLVVHVRLASAPSPEQDRAVASLERAGVPVVRIEVADPVDVGQEFFRWEIATAVAGSVLGVNPFDQPDVEAAKEAARRVTAAVEESGALPAESPVLEGDGLRLFADPENAREIAAGAREATPAGWLRAHLARLATGEYLAVNAFLDPRPDTVTLLQEIRAAAGAGARVATTLGFGPRYLHSTGQLQKGGPATGLFLEVTADEGPPLPIPGRRLGFGELCRAQARGDHEVLASRGRRILRVHLGADVRAGLLALRRALPR